MLLLILLGLMLVLFIVASAGCQGDVLSPSIVLTATFAVSIAFAWSMQDEWVWVTYTPRMAVVLAAGIMAFVAGEMITRILFLRNRQSREALGGSENTTSAPERRLLSIAKWKIITVSVLGAILIAWQYREVSRLAAIGGFVGGGNMLTYYRTQVSFTLSDEGLNPVLVQGLRFIEICGFIAAFVLVNNVMVWKARLSSNLLYLLPMALFVTKSLLNSDRGRVLWLVVFMTVTAFYLSWQSHAWRRPKIGQVVARTVVLSTVVMLGFYYIAGAVGRTSHATRTAFEYLAVYIGGPIGNFAQYIETPIVENEHFGQETFLNVYGILNTLGLSEFRSLSQLEFRYMEPQTRGNIYTFFRSLLQDFGFEGMLLISFVVASFFTLYVARFIKGREASRRSDQAIIVYGYLFFLLVTASVQNRLFLYFSVSAVTIVVGLLVMYTLMVDGPTRVDKPPTDKIPTHGRRSRRGLEGRVAL